MGVMGPGGGEGVGGRRGKDRKAPSPSPPILPTPLPHAALPPSQGTGILPILLLVLQ